MTNKRTIAVGPSSDGKKAHFRTIDATAGVQPQPEPDSSLRQQEKSVPVSNVDRMDNSINPPYPTLPVEPGEKAVDDYGDGVECVCGNTNGDDGFSAADRTGRLASLEAGPAPEGLGELHTPGLAVCNACGRIYDDGDLGTDTSPVLGRINTQTPEWNDARNLYCFHAFGEDPI